MGVLRQKLDLRIRLDDGKRKMVIHNKKSKPGVDVGTKLVNVSLFDLFNEAKAIL
jgi:hypothetical protein